MPLRFCPARLTKTCIPLWSSSGKPTALTHCSAQSQRYERIRPSGVAGQAGIGVVVSGDPTALPAPPFAATRSHLSGGDAATAATVAIADRRSIIAAANPGAWGNPPRLRADHNTADPGDDARSSISWSNCSTRTSNPPPVKASAIFRLILSPHGSSPPSSSRPRCLFARPALFPRRTGYNRPGGLMLAGGEDGGNVGGQRFHRPRNARREAGSLPTRGRRISSIFLSFRRSRPKWMCLMRSGPTPSVTARRVAPC